MTLLPHLAARLFGVPLAIHRPKLDVILAVLGARIGLADHDCANSPSRRPCAPAAHPPHIAVIPIHGTLVRRTVGLEAESGPDQLPGLGAINWMPRWPTRTSPAILLDVDSPGGESGGVFDLADRVRAAPQTKPVWAVANDMAFSAAYALASAASKVFVARTGGVGSIGVIAMHADQSVKDAKDGVRYTPVFAGRPQERPQPARADFPMRSPRLPQGRGRARLRPVRRHGRPHRGLERICQCAHRSRPVLRCKMPSIAGSPMPSAPSTTPCTTHRITFPSRRPTSRQAPGLSFNLQMESSMNDRNRTRCS
jgi:hypothetical protein